MLKIADMWYGDTQPWAESHILDKYFSSFSVWKPFKKCPVEVQGSSEKYSLLDGARTCFS